MPTPAPKPVSKSAPHRRRSLSGERPISTSVTTDTTTDSLSISFNNIGDYASHSRLVSTNNNNNNTTINKSGDRKATVDSSDDSSTSGESPKSLSLSLPDLVATEAQSQEHDRQAKQPPKAKGIPMKGPGFFTDPPPNKRSRARLL